MRAARLAAAWREGDPAEQDGDDAEAALLRRLLHDALHDAAGESLLPCAAPATRGP
jgi:hypothetical protein